MKRVENIVQDLLHELETSRTLHKQKARDVWEESVEEHIVDQTVVRSYKGGKLVIGVTNQPLLSQLENFRKQQLQNLLTENGLSSLNEIRFQAM